MNLNKYLLIVTGGMLLAMLNACGKLEDSGLPISSSPLAGTFFGTPFTAKTAISRFYKFPKEAWVYIYDSVVICENFTSGDFTNNPAFTERRIESIFSPWQDNSSYQLAGVSSVDFIVQDLPDTYKTFFVGRVEVIEAGDVTTHPSQPKPGVLRLRVNGDENNYVEGQVSVTFCPNNNP